MNKAVKILVLCGCLRSMLYCGVIKLEITMLTFSVRSQQLHN